MIANLFLDFFNRDSREIFGLFANTPRETHVRFLTEAVNVAAFLCSEYCILPPGFLAECEIGREAILRRADYVIERLIRLPLREDTLEEFWEKKRIEYSPFRATYAGLFDQKNEKLLRRFSKAIVTRQARIADEILRTWEQGPDTSSIWRDTMPGFNMRQVELIREVPRQIRSEGIAVTWPAIRARITDLKNAKSPAFRNILQNHYFNIYIGEYGLTVITRLPFARVDFALGGTDLSNDYEALKAALSALDIWNVMANLSADSVLGLRSKAGYYQFRNVFDAVAKEATTTWEVGECFARSVATAKPSRGLRKIIDTYSTALAPRDGYDLTESEIQAIADRLGGVGGASLEVARIREKEGRKSIPMSSPNSKVVAIYVALEIEREILVKRWKLTGGYPNPVWRGRLHKIDILLFGPDEMGRVSAAVATMQFLREYPKPDILLVMGIAGGFKREGVKLGDVLIATSVADLASRKIRKEGTTIPEFRPREYKTDPRIQKYLRSSSLDVSAWEQAVIEEAEWPEGRRPTLRYGPVASLDEVVSSKEWVDTLCKAWPKLLGVEMEAGGVCAAAASFELQVAVVRGVSDLADPAKSDDAWRRRAMKTIAHLIDSIDFDVLLDE